MFGLRVRAETPTAVARHSNNEIIPFMLTVLSDCAVIVQKYLPRNARYQATGPSFQLNQ